jgi:hypothetical protein
VPIDRYVFNVSPQAMRLPLIAVLFVSALPYFLADEWLTRAAAAAPGAYFITKLCFVFSLVGAIALHLFPWAASGRATANGRTEGFTKRLFDDSPEAHGHGKILGCGLVGPNAGDLIGEVALAIEMGADAVDIGKTIHPHPTLGKSIGMAAEVAHGSCTDLPPVRK